MWKLSRMRIKQILKRKTTCKMQFCLIITIALLIAVSIYCYLIKYQGNQEHLLPFHFANNKLKEVIYSKYKSKMSNKVKYIDSKNRTYYFFNDIANIKNFDPNNIKIDENSYKKIIIYYIGYMTIKDSKYVKIISVNPLYLILSIVNGYFKEINNNRSLTLVPTNESKGKIKNMKSFGVKSEI